MNLWPNIIANHLRDLFSKKQTKNEITHTIEKKDDMIDNKEYLLIEKDVWESVCSRVAALSQKMRIYEQDHHPAPQDYSNKGLQQFLGVGDKLVRKYRDKGLLSYTKAEGVYRYSQKDIVDFLEKNKHKSFDVKP